MRYFARCQYKGTQFFGWQKQKHSSNTVQETIENALFLFHREKIDIVGCGRTDTGVHASDYVFHFDANELDEVNAAHKWNRAIQTDDIVIQEVTRVASDAHARYDAKLRRYDYFLLNQRNPFRQETAFFYPQHKEIDFGKLQAAAHLIAQFKEFEPFCKTGSGVDHKKCNIFLSEWIKTSEGWQYSIEANRFLRGMIRLLVGMCINVSIGKIELSEVEEALRQQKRLETDWSVPGKGLFLSKVEY